MRRIFIAFPIPELLVQEFVRVQQELSKAYPKTAFRFMRPESLHMTIQFLGELEPYQIEQVRAILADIVPRYHSFSFQLDRVTGFPKSFAARVLVASFKEVDGTAATSLRSAISKRVKEADIHVDDKPFVAHVTLARTDVPLQMNVPIELAPMQFRAREVILYESQLSASGARYIVVETYSLV